MSANNKHARQAPDGQTFEDRRRHLRTNMRLKARYLGENGKEQPCVVINISAGGAMVKAKRVPASDEKVILYIDGVGRFESTVVRSGNFGFAVRYHSRRAKSQRTADALIRVLNKRGNIETDRRITPRIALDTLVTVTHEDGTSIDCTIMDVSLTGASICLDPQPPLGTELIVGRMRARVVRRHEHGVGVVFLGPNERMEDVIASTSERPKMLTHAPLSGSSGQSGIGVATPFGRKPHKD